MLRRPRGTREYSYSGVHVANTGIVDYVAVRQVSCLARPGGM